MVQTDKRNSLVRAAATLFHRKGFEHTSLADIAAAAGVPLGNVYYYFRTRDDLLKAVSDDLLANLRARREKWEELPSPKDRLLAWVETFDATAEECTAHGCRIGGLCLETNKLGGESAEIAASLLRSTLDWLAGQFRAMGFRGPRASAHAARVLGARQGSILLSNTFKDPDYIRLETARLKQWLEELPAPTKEKKP